MPCRIANPWPTGSDSPGLNARKVSWSSQDFCHFGSIRLNGYCLRPLDIRRVNVRESPGTCNCKFASFDRRRLEARAGTLRGRWRLGIMAMEMRIEEELRVLLVED